MSADTRVRFTLTKRGLVWHWEVQAPSMNPINGGSAWRKRTAREDALVTVQIVKMLVEIERGRNAS